MLTDVLVCEFVPWSATTDDFENVQSQICLFIVVMRLAT